MAGTSLPPRLTVYYAGVATLVAAVAVATAGFWVQTSLIAADRSPGERESAYLQLADAARQTRMLIATVTDLRSDTRQVGTSLIPSSLKRLEAAIAEAADPDSANAYASIPRAAERRPEEALSAVDAIAARAERLAAAEASAAERRSARTAALAFGAAGAAAVLLAGAGIYFLSAVERERRRYVGGIREEIPENIPGENDKARVAWLAHRDIRARRISDETKAERDELAQDLGAAKVAIKDRELRIRQDEMTGLWRLSHTLEELKRAVLAYLSTGQPFCLLALDLRKFKTINDTYGHKAGDQAIRDVADILREESRSTDVQCRRGGDEFIILMPNTTVEEALVVGERIVRRTESHSVVTLGRGGEEVRFGISTCIGIEDITTTERELLEARIYDDVALVDNQALHLILHNADRAQELAKNQEPGSIVVYSPKVDELLAGYQPPPDWGTFSRYAPQVFVQMTPEKREQFLFHYTPLYALVVGDGEGRSAEHSAFLH